jgi:hypothetical protein
VREELSGKDKGAVKEEEGKGHLRKGDSSRFTRV